MIRRRPSFYFAHGDCGCSGPQTYGRTQTGCDTGLVPATGAIIADNRYFSLPTSQTGQLLLVPKGSNAQHFLSAPNEGFVFFGSMGAYVEKEPKLSLPQLNPAVSGVHPEPPTFKMLVVGNGATPAQWLHVVAPSSGSYILQAKDGAFQMVDAGTIPGINQVGSEAGSASLGMPLVLVEDEDKPGTYIVRKLQIIHDRLYQGFVDPDSGHTGVRPIPTTAQAKHPRGHFMELQLGTYEQVGPLGNIIPGGMEQAIATGSGAIADGHLVWYSPANKKFYKIPQQTRSFRFRNTVDTFASIPAGYQALPGGHLVSENPITINYPTVRIDGQVSFGGDERATFGLHRDGILIQEFTVNNTTDCTMFYVEEGLPLGPHYWEFRWKKNGSGSGGGNVRFSSVMVTTLP